MLKNQTKQILFLILSILGYMAFAGNEFCPGYMNSGKTSQTVPRTLGKYSNFIAGYHFNLNFTGNKLPDQHVFYLVIDADTGKVIIPKTEVNGNLEFDDINDSSLFGISDPSYLTSHNKAIHRKLIISGLSIANYDLTTSFEYRISLDKLNYLVTISPFSGWGSDDASSPSVVSYSYTRYSVFPFNISQEPNDDLTHAGCAAWSWGPTINDPWVRHGWQSPKFIIDVSGEISYQPSYISYKNGTTVTNGGSFNLAGDHLEKVTNY